MSASEHITPTETDSAEVNGAAEAEHTDATEPKKKRSKPVIFFFALTGVLVLAVLVIIFYAVQDLRKEQAAEKPPVPAVVVAENLPTDDDPDADATDAPNPNVIVVEDTDFIHHNAKADDTDLAVRSERAKKPKTTQVTAEDLPSQIVYPNVSGDEKAATPVTTPSGSFSFSALVGQDEDDAKAAAKAAGYTTYSVYVCDSAAVNGSADEPLSGLVLATTSYTGRTAGEKYAFINVATSDPYSKATSVPNVKGLAWKSARSTLRGAGLGIRFAYEADSASLKGTVLFQAPAAGSFMPRNSTVVVVLAD
jgi:hypothetical protein